MSDLISVIVPSFNQGAFIEKTIQSIINQSYTKWELIIIDGGSKDETLSIVEKYNSYITYFCSEKDEGQSHAIAKGFEIATGSILCWLNSDDLLLPGALKCAAFELSKKNKQICYGDWVYIDENDNIIDKYYAFDINSNHLKYEGFHLSADSIFWHRNCIEFD